MSTWRFRADLDVDGHVTFGEGPAERQRDVFQIRRTGFFSQYRGALSSGYETALTNTSRASFRSETGLDFCREGRIGGVTGAGCWGAKFSGLASRNAGLWVVGAPRWRNLLNPRSPQ